MENNHDIWYGKTSPELSPVTRERTSESSSKKQRGSSIKTPLFLDLRGGSGGLRAVASWVTGGLLLGEYTMLSFGEFPKEERESHLSQILEEQAHPKYYLSAKACQGILRRAETRGKQLPKLLEQTLRKQSAFKNEPVVQGVKEYSSNTIESEQFQPSTINPSYQQTKVYGISAYDSNAMKSSNPHSGIYEADTSRTLDLNGGNPACNQGGMLVQQAICIGNGQLHDAMTPSVEVSKTLNCMEDPMKVVVPYGLDRASFNQGKNAQYNFSVEKDLAQTIVAKGPGGVMTKQ